jgi:hypothetical protein
MARSRMQIGWNRRNYLRMRIDQTGRPGFSTAPARARRAPSGFALPEPSAIDEPEAQPAATAAPSLVPATVSLGGMQQPAPSARSDQEAAQHGGALLDAMAGLQRAMLEGGPDAAATAPRAALARLAHTMPGGADPALRAVLQQIALRAAVELARCE